jgi:aminoglycoside phosphotransferase family enzyme
MSTAERAAMLAWLRDPRSYPDASRRVEVIETHFAWVFLTRTRAYKLKKPLRQGDMDYCTPARRRRGCEAEVRLNRRLARGVYLGVAPLCRDRQGRLRLRRGGRPLDWLVVMRRLAAARMLDFALRRAALSPADFGRVVQLLGTFFARAQPVGVTPPRLLQRLRRQGTADARELGAVRAAWRPRLRRVLALQRQFLARRGGELGLRAARVVEGHGDLRPEHIHLGPPVAVIDCLEFDRRLRWRDPAEELAYLRLELGRSGRARLGRRLSGAILERLGDAPGEALLCFYMSTQALTRAKLAAWHVGDPQFPDPQPWLRRAASYLEDARRCGARALRLAGVRLPAGLRRPVLQQRRQRPPVAHARQRLGKQRRDRQDRHAR